MLTHDRSSAKAIKVNWIDKDIMASKVYQDLNREFLQLKQEKERLEAELKERYDSPSKSAVSDNTSAIEDELKSQGQILGARNKRIKELKSEVRGKDMLINQLKREMEEYAEKLMQKEESEETLRLTVEALTEQLHQSASNGNEQTNQFKRKLLEM